MRVAVPLLCLAGLAACQQGSQTGSGADNAVAAATEPASPAADAPRGEAAADNPARLIGAWLAHVDEGDFSAAQSLFPSGGAPDVFDAYAPMTLEAFEVGEAAIEGAAGSLYATVPLSATITQDMTDESVSLEGTITLRRANEDPGSTPDQRRWRFERAELR